MSEKRSIKARDVIKDIRSGLTDSQLMEKYQLSEGRLKHVFEKLVDAKALDESEIRDRVTLAQESTSGRSARRMSRGYLMFSIPVYDTDNIEIEGWLVDLNQTGLQVSGIEAAVGDSRSLLIRADEFVDVYPFGFDAKCRWVEPDETQGVLNVGFEITGISSWGLQELRKLISLVTLSD